MLRLLEEAVRQNKERAAGEGFEATGRLWRGDRPGKPRRLGIPLGQTPTVKRMLVVPRT